MSPKHICYHARQKKGANSCLPLKGLSNIFLPRQILTEQLVLNKVAFCEGSRVEKLAKI